ncbi:MAG: FecR family protein [Odoribacteraceae bacterium]|jgi:ferric-dicitrate binding protein FerR (iron transport regulator)|nr:FecR family protein [Odoribacteraceae bacterium]
MIEQESIHELIARYLQGELDETRQARLKRWREHSVRNEELFQRVTSMKNAEEGIKRFIYPEQEQEETWQKLRRNITKRKLARTRWKIAGAATIALLLAAGGIAYHLATLPVARPVLADAGSDLLPTLLLPDGSRVNLADKEALDALVDVHPGLQAGEASLSYRQRAVEAVEHHVLRVPCGGEYVLVLSDNTTVHLNAGSELTYPATFPGERRDVYLKGEAYFDVQGDERWPFTVHAGPARVEVLGTAFGVRAYDDEPVIQTVLERGKIKLHVGDRSLLLDPNTRASYDRNTAVMEKFPANPSAFLGWKEGHFIYDNAPLEYILRDMSRWYSFDVIFRREEARQLPFSLNVKKHGSVDEVLSLLEETRNIRFEYHGNTVIIL